jgi:hypothetical protein
MKPERIETKELVRRLHSMANNTARFGETETFNAIAARLTEPEKDRERLDFLWSTDKWFDVPSNGEWTAESFRQAIDDAMEETK